ncbi:MAG: hypothetical protein AAGA60_30210 [Cyanobacteria bacterium P01_E01_bin.42]
MANNKKHKKHPKKNNPANPSPNRGSSPPQKSQEKKVKAESSGNSGSDGKEPVEDAWQPYNLDHYAQDLVIQYRDKNVLGESHKMRMTVAYGLERFWGEPFRLEQQKEGDKAAYWRSVWDAVAEKILKPAGIILPNRQVEGDDPDEIRAIAEEIWQMADGEVALMVLTQFCDSLVWWAQRYKKR